MSELIAELLLRTAKLVAAGVVALPIYLTAAAVDPTAAGGILAVASYAAGAGVILLFASSPL